MGRPVMSTSALCVALFLVMSNVALAAPPGPQGPQQGAEPPTLDSQPTAPTGGGACPGLSSKTYSGWEFRTLAADTEVEYMTGSGSIYRAAGHDYIDLPLDLPQGAQIIQINYYYVDNLASNIGFWLVRYTPSTGGYGSVQSMSSSGQSTSVRSAIMLAAEACAPIVTVDNVSHRYALEVEFHATGDQARLYGAAVLYRIPTVYVPLVFRQL